MHYTEKLKTEIDMAAMAAVEVANRINEFRTLLQSSKFSADTTIQVGDVHRWLSYIQEGGLNC